MHYNPPYREAKLKLLVSMTGLQDAEREARGLFQTATPVAGIDEVDGWRLLEIDSDDLSKIAISAYVARRDGLDVLLNTSTRHFIPTNERFAWIVRAGFPLGKIAPGGAIGPLTNDFIDAGIIAGCRSASDVREMICSANASGRR